MGNNCKTIVYLTTNIKNKKIYIGVHDTKEPDGFDGYIGCGVDINWPRSIAHPKTPFQYAVKKYGFDSFVRTTLKVCDTRKEALQIERILVDENFIKRNDTYNIELGGGDPPRNDLPVYKYTLTGDFIEAFSNRRDAEKSVGVTSGVSIAVKTKTICGGFLWADEKVEKLNLSEYKIVTQKTPIYIYSNTGEFIIKYESISDFCKENKVTIGPVQRALASKTKIKGFYISDKKVSKFEKEKIKKSPSKIYQYELSGKFVTEWKSCADVQRVLGNKYSQISSNLRCGNTICGNYQWSRIKLSEMSNKEKPILKKKIGQFDLQGNFIKSFETVRECRKEFGNVSRVLSGKCNQCKGFTFKYLDN